MGQQWIPFAVCAFFGALLAVVELLQTFGRWMGSHWLNRYVARLVVFNVLAACGVYVFLRFGLGVEDTLSLAAVTGLTFPAILRSKLTFFRAESKEEGSPRELSLPLDVWYRNLQEMCIEEVNSRIADATARKMRSLRRILSEQKMVEILSDHIAAEPREESRAKHQRQVGEIQAGPDPNDRLRLLARLMLEIIPEGTIQELLDGVEA